MSIWKVTFFLVLNYHNLLHKDYPLLNFTIDSQNLGEIRKYCTDYAKSI